jgi:hypothetical protein
MPKKMGYGKGVLKQPTNKPGYPKKEEGVASTKQSPEYPRDNHYGGKKY